MNEFIAMHREMEKWCDQQEKIGWKSEEMKHWAHFVKLQLAQLGMTRKVLPVQLKFLAEYTAELQKAAANENLHISQKD